AFPSRSARIYAEQPYETDFADLVAPRLALAPGVTPVGGPRRGRWRKTLAICSYTSQVRALGVDLLRRAGLASESYWDVPGPPPTR
ncbi:MAG: hypothetical protein ACRDTP_11810, partial [Mycobacteriales bacterium]